MNHNIEKLIELALEEDIGSGDITTAILVPPEAEGRGLVIAGEKMVVSGLNVAGAVFRRLDLASDIKFHCRNGDSVNEGDLLFEVSGKLSALLTAERTALNFLQRLCGIATMTRQWVDLLSGSTAKLTDTRKTAPGWRVLEKQAVRDGGAYNHRMSLADGVLIKDNHLAFYGDIGEAVRLTKKKAPSLVRIEVEVEDMEGLSAAVEAGADVVLLDNMSNDDIRAAVKAAGGKVLLEASGNITAKRLPSLASIGVDYISCGALTHSAPSADISLEIIP